MPRTILVTGAAGFIGYHVSRALLERGDTVIGIDNINEYYDPRLKESRVKLLENYVRFTLVRADIRDEQAVEEVYINTRFDSVCHLAAQGGVRYSLENPLAFITTNVLGSTVIFELAHRHGVKSVVYASSSSIYGNRADAAPFHEHDSTDHPISVYAATKKSCEVIAYTYHHLHNLNMTGLRFFTVYGPWGRPDMSPIKFAKAIWEGKPLDVYNKGNMMRDFTYIDDIVDGVVAALDQPLGYALINLGGANATELGTYIALIARHIGKPAIKNELPMQPGDVAHTSADTTQAKELLGWQPRVSLDQGIGRFCAWFKEYYG